MKNFKLNSNIKNVLLRGIALISTITVVGFFSGCTDEKTDDNSKQYSVPTVSDQVENNIEARKQKIISECISQYRYLSEEEVNEIIKERLASEHLIPAEEGKYQEKVKKIS